MNATTSALKPQGPIWTVLGIAKQDWQQALENAQFFSARHLKALDEIAARQLAAGLHKAWGADYAANERAASKYLNDSGRQFFEARDDEGHAFRFMPMYWEAALAASQQAQPSLQP